MAIPNVLSAVYDAIWAALESRSRWKAIVGENNRLKIVDGRANPFKETWGDSDFPQAVVLTVEGEDSLDELPGPKTFGQIKSGCAPRIEEIRITHAIGITHKEIAKSLNRELILETFAALRDVRAALHAAVNALAAYAAVKTAGPLSWRHDDTGRSPAFVPGAVDPAGALRPQTLFRLPVVIAMNSATAAGMLDG